MKKLIKRLVSFVLALLLLVVGLVLFVGLAPFDFAGSKYTDKDFSSVVADNVSQSARVVDIAMLGAHDAFSHLITTKSEVDPAEAEDAIFRNKLVGTLAGGMVTRLLKAQRSGASGLLRHGVRYLDVRISLIEGEFYTKHAKISGRLDGYLDDVIDFLTHNQGELVIFDMQHVYTGDGSMQDVFDYLASHKKDGVSLVDFVRYDPATTPLETLTYAMTAGTPENTADALQSGVVILAKADQYPLCKHYKYGDSMRSVWHNSNDTGEMLSGIAQEYNALKADPTLDRNKFRVNQAQKTGVFSSDVILKTIVGWSLLDMANNFNKTLVEHTDFENWLEVLPIFMVDNADSMKGDFNEKAIEKINAFNASL